MDKDTFFSRRTWLAATIKDAKISPKNHPAPSAPQTVTGKELFDIPALDGIVKYTGVVNGPTYKYTVGRSDLTMMAMGAEMTAAIVGALVGSVFVIATRSIVDATSAVIAILTVLALISTSKNYRNRTSHC